MGDNELKPEDWTYERRAELQAALSEIFKEQPEATIPMRQLLELVGREKQALERIQELEGVADNYNTLIASQDLRIKELEAHVERLRSWLIECHDAHDDYYIGQSEVIAAIDSTPAQSLEAVKREALEQFQFYLNARADDDHFADEGDAAKAIAFVDGYIADFYDD